MFLLVAFFFHFIIATTAIIMQRFIIIFAISLLGFIFFFLQFFGMACSLWCVCSEINREKYSPQYILIPSIMTLCISHIHIFSIYSQYFFLFFSYSWLYTEKNTNGAVTVSRSNSIYARILGIKSFKILLNSKEVKKTTKIQRKQSIRTIKRKNCFFNEIH